MHRLLHDIPQFLILFVGQLFFMSNQGLSIRVRVNPDFRIISEFRILRLTFQRKSASKSSIRQNIIASLIVTF